MINNIKAVAVIVGAVIGAGFASGQEIYSFFNAYNANGLLGIVVSSILLGIIIYKVLKRANKYNLKNYNELLEHMNVPSKIKQVFSIIINLFLLISFYIMVAGFAAYFKQEFGIHKIVTAIIISFICFKIFMKNIDGITNASIKIVPILVLIIIALGIRLNAINTLKEITITDIQIKTGWLIKAIEYTSYNSILLIPVLISLRKYSENSEKIISIVTSIIFGTLAIIIYLVMYNKVDIATLEIPLIEIANKYGIVYKYGYSIALVFAIYTTMLSEGFGFLNNTAQNPKQYKKIAIAICISAVFISNISFSNLINLTYPVFGILGIGQLAYLMIAK